MYIYKITNRLTGKSYIGQTTKNPVVRWKQHCRSGKYGIGRALKKYGKESFTFQVIFTASDKDNLDKMEKIFIKMYDTMGPNGYNLREGGSTPKHSEETRKKISESHKGKKKSKETKQKISRVKSKPIICLETGEEFVSGKECAEKMSLNRGHIASVLKGKRKTTGGYTFSYVAQGEPK